MKTNFEENSEFVFICGICQIQTGEGGERDLSPIGVVVRGVELPLPCREGYGRDFYLVRWRGHLQSKSSMLGGLGVSPSGETGEGFLS